MRISQDLSHEKYGRLTVLGFHSYTYNKLGHVKEHMWICKCECGNVTIVRKDHLKSGRIVGCGCLTKKKPTHGMWDTRFYNIWRTMKQRCSSYAPKHNRKHYYEKGIRVCDKWKIFENFYEDMYEPYLTHTKIHGEKNTTLDRVDSDENYCKSNCRWATWEVQNNNKK